MIVTVTLNTSMDRTVEVPGFAVGGTLKGRVLRRQPAGKGINVSRCLAELGHRSIASGFVGRGELAAFIESLEPLDVTDRLVGVEGRTRDNTTYLDPIGGTETHVREEGFHIDEDDLKRLDDVLAAIVRSGDTAVFAGSVPPGAPASSLAELAGACRKRGARVVIDGSGESYRRAVSAGAHLIKPNLSELADLTGQEVVSTTDAVAAARTLLGRVGIVVASMGQDGAVCVAPDGAWHAQCPLAEVAQTVGCGDALLAGFLAGTERALPLPECLSLAVACGAAAARCTIAGELRRTDVDELLPKVRLMRVGE